ncbi:hypothetical protein NIES4102_09770 [Chondrocystis sp. NIES-4102]|nr:hypothetical protein NIES4102_09770 [Chondrocystis sp. NIES-4102]
MSSTDNYDQGKPISGQDSWISLEVYVKANQPDLLTGLDQWLQLNLITHAQVKKLCRNHLSCALPLKETVIIAAKGEAEMIAAQDINHFNIISRLWQGFLDELSIRWLLFLGIFLVIISSGVLAASQWQSFPTIGQYLILLVYTLCFWVISFWLSKQENQKLTWQTLNSIATLLVPINFWAINQFSLGNNIIELGIVIVALIILTSIIYWRSLLKSRDNYQLILPLFLLLSYLHLGWHIAFLPLIAVYGGVLTIGWVYYRFRHNSLLYFFFLLAAWLLLLGRALTNNFTTNYSMAIALGGWLVATVNLTEFKKPRSTALTLAQTQIIKQVLQFISIATLIIAWIISLRGAILQSTWFYWQTLVINILVISLFTQRLTLNWQKRDLSIIFLWGLQTLYLTKELIPLAWRTEVLDLVTKISKTTYLPESIFGVTLFPYIILYILIASWLIRRQKTTLAIYTEYITLLLGITLTYLSSYNPIWLLLNLFLSTATLAYITWIRYPIRVPLIYITHLLGIITLTKTIALYFPNLNQSTWGSIFLILMVVEWYIYLQQPKTHQKYNFPSLIKQSCWYFGLCLAATSYTFLLTSNTLLLKLIWLITPCSFTIIAQHSRKPQQRRITTYLSCIALVATQILVYGRWETRILGLAVAVGLMFFNAYHWRRTIITIIHVGFCLALLTSVINLVVRGNYWVLIGAAIILGLYQCRQYLKYSQDTPKFDYISQRRAHGILGVGVETKNYKLIAKYIQAIDYWAIALIVVEIVFLSIMGVNNRDIQGILGILLLITAIIWRYRQQPNNWVLYTLVWLGELLAVGITFSLGGNGVVAAVSNICLGFLALGLRRWVSRISAWGKLNLADPPLIYAVLAILWRLAYFNSYTGWLTLAVALILFNTQHPKGKLNKIISYSGFAAITGGIYEIAVALIWQSSRVNIAQGLTILALITAAIAFTYRLGVRWYGNSDKQVIFIAHLHWAVASILKIIVAGITLKSATVGFTGINIATNFCLGAYALIQGKDRNSQTNRINDWVYLGLVEIIATLFYSRLIISQLSVFDPWRVIFTCAIALFCYQIPWNNLGWRVTPWRRTAIVMPMLVAIVTLENISYISLLVTGIFYLRIAYAYKNIRWSYLSLGLINWATIKLVWQLQTEFIFVAAIITLSILYIAQIDPYLKSHRQRRHYIRLLGSNILCLTALSYQEFGIIPAVISLSLILLGLGLKIRAFLFTGTITIIFTVIYQLIILVLAYPFFKWIIGLITGICAILMAAKFEQKRAQLNNHLQNYASKLQSWQ